jgi:hypothetical protein
MCPQVRHGARNWRRRGEVGDSGRENSGGFRCGKSDFSKKEPRVRAGRAGLPRWYEIAARRLLRAKFFRFSAKPLPLAGAGIQTDRARDHVLSQLFGIEHDLGRFREISPRLRSSNKTIGPADVVKADPGSRWRSSASAPRPLRPALRRWHRACSNYPLLCKATATKTGVSRLCRIGARRL